MALGRSDIAAMTMLAPAILSCWPSSAVAWLAPAKPIVFMPAATAARMPSVESSMTMQLAGATANERAANR